MSRNNGLANWILSVTHSYVADFNIRLVALPVLGRDVIFDDVALRTYRPVIFVILWKVLVSCREIEIFFLLFFTFYDFL